MKKKIVVLGSTGSLGKQMLEVLQKNRKHFEIVGLSGNKNEKLLKEQAKNFGVKRIVLASEKQIILLAKLPEADMVINLLSAIAGIKPTIAALKAGKIVLLANKESIVAEGEKIMNLARKHSRASLSAALLEKSNHPNLPPPNLIPIDSEHNGVYEILKKYPRGKIDVVVLPCSGGPFLGKSKKQLTEITAAQAITHPKWKMGAKISVESATLINKGLEVIEAHHLFNLPIKKIQIKIHPECQIHGIVKFKSIVKSGSAGKTTPPLERPISIAYFAPPDMREHLENALLRAGNLPIPPRQIRPLRKKEFIFLSPDHKIFPGIKIVLKHFQVGSQKMKSFLAKEEKIIQRFLDGKIAFSEIFSSLK